jgi:hypothetical protein
MKPVGPRSQGPLAHRDIEHYGAPTSAMTNDAASRIHRKVPAVCTANTANSELITIWKYVHTTRADDVLYWIT